MKMTMTTIACLVSLLALAVVPALAQDAVSGPSAPPATSIQPSPAPAPAAGTAGASGPATASAPAAAAAVDPHRTEAVAEVEFGGIDQDGAVGNIREYDRRKYSAGDVRRLQVDHYANRGMFKLHLAHPLTQNWTDLNMRWHGDSLNARYDMSFLTHNMTSNYQNFVVDGQRQLMFPIQLPNTAAADALLRANELSFNPNANRRDVDLGFEFFLNRQEHDARLDWGQLWDKRLRLSYWAEREYGLPEHTGPNARDVSAPAAVAFSTVEHPQTSFKHPYKRYYDEVEVGGDGRIDKAALYGTYFHAELDDVTPEYYVLMRGGGGADLRTSLFNFPERETDGFRGGLSYAIGDDAKVRLNHVSRERSSSFNGYKLDFDTFTASADWDPADDWSVFGQFRHHERDTNRNAAYLPPDSVNIRPLNPPAFVNESTLQGVYDEEDDEFEIGFRYSGWKNHTISAGYRHESIDQPNAYRTQNALVRFSGDLTGHNEFLARGVNNVLNTVNESLERDGFWLKTNGNPTRRLSYRTSFEDWDANRDYTTRGVALDERNLSANVFYDFEPDLQGYLEVINNKHEANQDPFSENFKSFTLGAQGMFHEVGVGLAYTHETFHQSYLFNWQLPSTFGRVTPYAANEVEFVSSRNDVYSLNLTPPRFAHDRLQFSLNYTYTDSRSYQPMASYDFAGPADVVFIEDAQYDDVNGIDVTINRFRLQTEYDLRTKRKAGDGRENDVIGLDLNYGRWTDDIDFRQSGNFTTAWLTYRRRL